jgi:hypothetical protein
MECGLLCPKWASNGLTFTPEQIEQIIARANHQCAVLMRCSLRAVFASGKRLLDVPDFMLAH